MTAPSLQFSHLEAITSAADDFERAKGFFGEALSLPPATEVGKCLGDTILKTEDTSGIGECCLTGGDDHRRRQAPRGGQWAELGPAGGLKQDMVNRRSEVPR